MGRTGRIEKEKASEGCPVAVPARRCPFLLHAFPFTLPGAGFRDEGSSGPLETRLPPSGSCAFLQVNFASSLNQYHVLCGPRFYAASSDLERKSRARSRICILLFQFKVNVIKTFQVVPLSLGIGMACQGCCCYIGHKINAHLSIMILFQKPSESRVVSWREGWRWLGLISTPMLW